MKRIFSRRTTVSTTGLSARVALIYAVCAGLWIALSDLLIASLFHDAEIITRLSIHKGLFFVLVSAALLYVLVFRATRRIKQSEGAFEAVVDSVPQAVFWKDPQGVYLGCNAAFARYAGLNSANEVVGKTDFDLLPARSFAENYRADDKEVMDRLQPKRHIIERITGGGRDIWVDTSKVPLLDDRRRLVGVLGIFDDITERKRVQEELERSLREKEVLLRELYHRTKNNMQVICSLLELQTLYSSNHELVQVLREMGNRIRSMALVHQKLYQSGNLERVNLAEYLSDLTNLLKKSHALPGVPVDFILDLQPVLVSIDSAIPCGLILNELLSNALKYAFAGRTSGEIQVLLERPEERNIKLVVSDNGVGFPPNFSPEADGRLGIATVMSIVGHQLRGKINFDSRNGVNCMILFKEPDGQER